MIRHAFALALLLCSATIVSADPPTASYIFPAGARRGTTVPVIVGGLSLYKSCGFEMLGLGVTAERTLSRIKTLWFEGPVLPLPDSQQQEDYPKDMAGRVTVAADAPLGLRYWRVWTAQGATSAQKFVVGDLPEVVEQEIDGDPVPVEVKPPVTINGRIFPREDVDVWTFAAAKGQTYTCAVTAARLGSPLEARLEVQGPDGRRLAEKLADGGDPVLRFTAPADGHYAVRIQDVNAHGGQAYVYRLTITADPYVDRVYPLGGNRGSRTKFETFGQALPAAPIELALPADAPLDYAVRLNAGGKLTNPVVLDLDDLPEYLEGQTKLPVAAPAILNGRIAKPGDVGTWDLILKKGEAVDIELRAGRLGSPLRGVLIVLDAASKELARADAVGAGQVDPSLRFTPPADGTYRIRVEERFRHRGGLDFAYRLRVAPPSARRDFRLTLMTDVVSVDRGGKAVWKVTAERLGGFNEPITLTVEGLPPGVTAKPVTIAAGQAAGDFAVTIDKTARIQASRLTIRGSAKIGEQIVTRTALWHGPPNSPHYLHRGEPGVDSLLLAVTLPTPFQIVGEYDMRWAARGTVHHRKYRIERHGYDGPIEVMLADHQARHLQGVSGPTITVPAGATEFEYPATLPPWMEMGRTSAHLRHGCGSAEGPGRRASRQFHVHPAK